MKREFSHSIFLFFLCFISDYSLLRMPVQRNGNIPWPNAQPIAEFKKKRSLIKVIVILKWTYALHRQFYLFMLIIDVYFFITACSHTGPLRLRKIYPFITISTFGNCKHTQEHCTDYVACDTSTYTD